MAVPLEVVLGSNHPDHAAYIGSNEAWDSTMPLPEANSNSKYCPYSVPQFSLRLFSCQRVVSVVLLDLHGVA